MGEPGELRHLGVTAYDTGGDTGRYLSALREHWPYILGTIVLCVVAALAYVRMAESRYEAHADLLVAPVSTDTLLGISVLRESDFSRSVVTAARLVETPQVEDEVQRRLGSSSDAETVTVTPQEQSNVLTITAQAPTPADAARIANAYADVVLERRRVEFERSVRAAVERLTRRLRELPAEEERSAEANALADRLSDLRQLLGAPDPTLRLVSRAVPPADASWPRPALTLLVAVVAGLLLGLGVAVAIELLNPFVMRESHLVRAFPYPILCRVPPLSDAAARDVLTGRRRLPRDGYEVLRRLRVALDTGGWIRPATIVVTSPGEDDARAATAVYVARAQASGRRTVLITLERQSSSAVAFDVSSGGDEDGDGAAARELGDLRRTDDGSADGTSGLRRASAQDTIEETRSQADVIVVDSPSPTEDADGLEVSRRADQIVLVVRLGRTRRDRLVELVRLLARRSDSLAGFVVVERGRPIRLPIVDATARPPDADRPRSPAEEDVARDIR